MTAIDKWTYECRKSKALQQCTLRV